MDDPSESLLASEKAQRIAAKIEALEALAIALRHDFQHYVAHAEKPPVVPQIPTLEPEHETPDRVLAQVMKNISADVDSKPTAVNLEQLIAGKGLFVAGLVLVALAAAFFLKIAFDTWIGPLGRVWLGGLLGIVIVIGGMRYCRGSLQRFGDGVIALGCVIELFTIYAATLLFHLIEPFAGLCFTGIVVLAMTFLAMYRDSEFLAIGGALGGLASCMLLAGPPGNSMVETSYVGAINAALLPLAHKRLWRNLRSSVIIATIGALETIWAIYPMSHRLNVVFVAIIFYGGFIASAFAERSDKQSIRRFESVASLLAFGTVISTCFYQLYFFEQPRLYFFERPLLTGSLMLVAGIHALRAMIDGSWRQMRYAVSAAAMAIGVAFNEDFRKIALCFDAAVLYALGISQRDQLFRVAGCALLIGEAFYFFDLNVTAPALPVLNVHFLYCCAWAAAAIFLEKQMRQSSQTSTFENEILKPILPSAAHLVLVYAVSIDTWFTAQRYAENIAALDETAVQQVALSLAWIIFSTALLTLGFSRRSSLMRWEGLLLIGVVLLKLLIIDLSSLALSYRVVSALVVGIFALIIAANYQRIQFFGLMPTSPDGRPSDEETSPLL